MHDIINRLAITFDDVLLEPAVSALQGLNLPVIHDQTNEILAEIESIVSRFRQQHPHSQALLVCSGIVSPAAERQFSAAGIPTASRR